ncbi:MAG TPA: hypothetical protein VFK33_02860 [Bacillales bacterium]|nr:hypothetical protein [Bacillales bacterium]
MKKTFLVPLMFLIGVLSGCTDGFHQMVGVVDAIHFQKNRLVLDVSDWMIHEKGKQPFVGYGYVANIGKSTIIQSEEGKKVSLKNIKIGQKVRVVELEEHKFAKKITLLKMTRKEKLGDLLPGEKALNIVVLYTQAHTFNGKLDHLEMVFDNPRIDNVSYKPYNPNYVMDYKKAFGIRKLPVILVLDSHGLVFKTHKVDVLKDHFSDDFEKGK